MSANLSRVRILEPGEVKKGEVVVFVGFAVLQPGQERRTRENPEMREKFMVVDGVMDLIYFEKSNGDLKTTQTLRYKQGEIFEIPKAKIYKNANMQKCPLRYVCVGITTNPDAKSIDYEEVGGNIV